MPEQGAEEPEREPEREPRPKTQPAGTGAADTEVADTEVADTEVGGMGAGAAGARDSASTTGRAGPAASKPDDDAAARRRMAAIVGSLVVLVIAVVVALAVLRPFGGAKLDPKGASETVATTSEPTSEPGAGMVQVMTRDVTVPVDQEWTDTGVAMPAGGLGAHRGQRDRVSRLR